MNAESGQRRNSAGAAIGIGFVVLFIGGIIPIGDLFGSFGDSDATFDTYFASTSHRIGNIVGGALLGLSGFVFLWFLQHLRAWLQPGGVAGAKLAGFMFAAGHVFVVLLLVGTAAFVTVPVTLAFGGLFDETEILAVGKAILPQFGYVIVALYGFWAAGAMVVAATISGRRSGSFPRWLCRLGYVASGFLVLLGFSGGMAFFALPAWVLAVSLHWARRA